MTSHSMRFTAAALTFALSSISTSADQVRREPPGASLEAIVVTLKVGAAPYEATAKGSCTHAPKASIHGLLSEMWTVRQDGGGRSVQLTLWKPADGSTQMFSLSIAGKSNVNVSTIRGGQMSGSGTVSLGVSGKGGTFTIDAKDTSGERISGTIKCEAFSAAVAEGGDYDGS